VNSNLRAKTLELHRINQGKVAIKSKVEVRTQEDLSMVYTPGVAEPCREISKNPGLVWEYTARGKMIAVVTDGSAVLGLGNIGPEAALPVMEGKCVLFKVYGGVDAFPLCLATQEVTKVVEVVKLISPTIGGVNLEDISAPRCFEIEKRLKEETDIPIFHDDQHGTAIVVAAGLINALKLVGKSVEDVKVTINGAGAAGTAVAKFLSGLGVGEIIVCDRKGAIYQGRKENMDCYKEELALFTNREGVKTLQDALKGSDVFIGLSVGGVLTAEMVKTMAKDPIIFALANPEPEIYPEEARQGGAYVVATGRSDFPNQINNLLAFPGVLKGALEVRARDINMAMKIAAAQAIASLVEEDELDVGYIIPSALDRRVAPSVAAAVAGAAIESGVARIRKDPSDVAAAVKRDTGQS